MAPRLSPSPQHSQNGGVWPPPPTSLRAMQHGHRRLPTRTMSPDSTCGLEILEGPSMLPSGRQKPTDSMPLMYLFRCSWSSLLMGSSYRYMPLGSPRSVPLSNCGDRPIARDIFASHATVSRLQNSFFFFFIYLFIWLFQILIAAYGIFDLLCGLFSCNMHILSYNIWDLIS